MREQHGTEKQPQSEDIFVSSWLCLMTSVAPTQLKLKYINNPITLSSP